jgi:hypothetical protein
MSSKKFEIVSLTICLAVISAACGNPAQTQFEIETAVAQTVQAQNSLTKVSALPTLTPAAPTQGALSTPTNSTPGIDSTNTPSTSSNPGCVASAELVSESPPDETLLSPGEYFWKTWTFLNTGTCYWDKSYSLVFWDGDIMGGLASYPLSEVVAPNETFDISIYLQAPATEGIVAGYWRFKSPWSEYFGVGPQNLSFYVQVNVSTNLKYEVVSVTYKMERQPATGCPLNVRFIVTAFVTTNGPMGFDYRWDQSDGNNSGIRHFEVEKAETVTFKREWLISLNDNPVPRWINFIITGPKYKDFGSIVWEHECL